MPVIPGSLLQLLNLQGSGRNPKEKTVYEEINISKRIMKRRAKNKVASKTRTAQRKHAKGKG